MDTHVNAIQWLEDTNVSKYICLYFVREFILEVVIMFWLPIWFALFPHFETRAGFIIIAATQTCLTQEIFFLLLSCGLEKMRKKNVVRRMIEDCIFLNLLKGDINGIIKKTLCRSVFIYLYPSRH